MFAITAGASHRAILAGIYTGFFFKLGRRSQLPLAKRCQVLPAVLVATEQHLCGHNGHHQLRVTRIDNGGSRPCAASNRRNVSFNSLRMGRPKETLLTPALA